MAITAESLTELIQETHDAFEETETKLAAAQELVASLAQELESLIAEEQAFRATLARRFPETVIDEAEQPKRGIPAPFLLSNDDWTTDSRSDVVHRAVQQLTSEKGFATPTEIETTLALHGRDDNKDNIGASLAYLNRTHKIHRRARAEWVDGQADLNTSGSLLEQ